MAYDPYGGQTPEQQSNWDITKDVLTAPLRPSTYLYPYTMWPGVYSNKKGLWTPIETRKNKWIEEFGNIKSSWKSGKMTGVKGTYTSLMRLGPLGKDHRRIIGNASKLKELKLKNEERYRKASKYQNRETSFKNAYLKQKTHIEVGWNNAEYIGGKGPRENLRMAVMKRDVLKKQYTRYSESHSNYLKSTLSKITETEKVIKLRTLTKWGMRVGKAGSLIGAGMLAWDLASMVAAPLAQAGMNILNSAANTFQSRYMPEMGGQLQLSYLSQGAATERQRAIQSLSKSSLNARAGFGSEGKMIHEGY